MDINVKRWNTTLSIDSIEVKDTDFHITWRPFTENELEYFRGQKKETIIKKVFNKPKTEKKKINFKKK